MQYFIGYLCNILMFEQYDNMSDVAHSNFCWSIYRIGLQICWPDNIIIYENIARKC